MGSRCCDAGKPGCAGFGAGGGVGGVDCRSAGGDGDGAEDDGGAGRGRVGDGAAQHGCGVQPRVAVVVEWVAAAAVLCGVPPRGDGAVDVCGVGVAAAGGDRGDAGDRGADEQAGGGVTGGGDAGGVEGAAGPLVAVPCCAVGDGGVLVCGAWVGGVMGGQCGAREQMWWAEIVCVRN